MIRYNNDMSDYLEGENAYEMNLPCKRTFYSIKSTEITREINQDINGFLRMGNGPQ